MCSDRLTHCDTRNSQMAQGIKLSNQRRSVVTRKPDVHSDGFKAYVPYIYSTNRQELLHGTLD